MHKDQRARLVLNPIGLVILLVGAGLAVGLGISSLRRSDSPARAFNRDAGRGTATIQIVLSSDRLDFGELSLDRTVVRHLLMRNTGSETLRLRFESGGVFAVSPGEMTLEAGKVSRVTVSASVKQPGSIREELRIFTNDGAGQPLVVMLEGVARDPSSTLDALADAGAAEGAAPGAPYGVGSPGSTAFVDRRFAGGQPHPVTPLDSQAPGSVNIVAARTNRALDETGGSYGATGEVDRAASGPVIGAPHFMPSARTMSDRPDHPSPDQPARRDETPVPVRPGSPSKAPSLDEQPRPSSRPPKPTTPLLAVSPSSSISIMGSSNRFYPQSVRVYGSHRGGSFSLGSSFQLPNIPLAFGQSIAFSQSGSAVGSFDPASGEVKLDLPIDAIDPNGYAAPMVIPMTTGTVVARNDSGILISMSGSPRMQENGQLRLVGVGRVPVGYRNGAEERIVIVEIVGALSFPAPESNSPSGEGDLRGSL